METYLSSVNAIDSLAIDYMVHPTPRVLNGTSLLESDGNLKTTTLGIDECATEISVPSIFAEAQNDGVHVARVRLDEPYDVSRSARVFASRGERAITIDTAGVTSLSDAQSDWYVLFEPVNGPARITLRHLGALPAKVTLGDLPPTPGVVAIFRSEAIAPAEDRRVIYGNTGFAQGWRLFAEDWHGVVVPARPTEELTLKRRSMPAELLHVSIEETVELDSEAPTALLMFRPGLALPDEFITVIVPCGAHYRVSFDGFGDAEVVANETTLLGAGGVSEGVAACEDGAVGAEVRVRAFADGVRSAYIIVTHGESLL